MRGRFTIRTICAAGAIALVLTGCSSGENWRERFRAKSPSAEAPPVAIGHSEITDQVLEENIYSSFFRTDVALFSQVLVDVREGYVILSGSVTSPADRLRAAQLTWEHTAVRGVRSDIVIAAGPGLEGASRDRWISNQIAQRLEVDDQITAKRFTVETLGREVYVLGEAGSLYELDLVIEHARNTPYVRRVVNQARIARDS